MSSAKLTYKSPSFKQVVQDPIFIVGAARSGTTRVFDILNAHPEVAGVYESWLFTSNNGIGSLFMSAHYPTKSSGLGRLLKRENLITYVRDLTRRIMEHSLKPEHRFLVEKSPSHLFSMPLINEIFPGSRFIHVIRDGRDVCISVRAAAKSWAPAWRETFGRSIIASARAWKHAIRHARHNGKKMGGRFFEIRYEELSKDPFGSYGSLFDFCEIPYNNKILKTIYDATDFDRNFKPKETGFRRRGRVGDWRLHFSLKDSLLFNYVAGEMLLELGYEKNRRWYWHFW